MSPSPVPGPGEVVVSVKAASVNFPDILIIQNKYQTEAAAAVFARAASCAGVVKAVGDGVTHVQARRSRSWRSPATARSPKK